MPCLKDGMWRGEKTEFVPDNIDRAVTGFKTGALIAAAGSGFGGYLFGYHINNYFGIENTICRGAVDLGAIVALLIPFVPICSIAIGAIGWYASPLVDYFQKLNESVIEQYKQRII